MGNFNYKKYLAEGKLNEALAPQDVVDIADTVAEEFTKESADEGDFLIYTVGRMEGESFELDTDTTAQTPDSVDPIGVGEGWGGNFSIKPKGEGYEVRNGEKGGLVAIIDSMGNFKMLSAAESRAEMGMADGERTDYMERRRETSDYMQEVLGQIKETLDDEAFDMAEKIIDSLGAEKAVGELVRAMSTDDAKLYLGGIIRDYDLKEEMDQDDNEFLQFTDMDKPAATETKYYEDKVDEKIKEKPSTNNKMKKSELKEMIKAAMMFEAEDSKKGNKEEQERMEGAIRDDRDHIKDLEKDIKDNEEKLAKLKKDFKDDVNEEKVDEGSKYYEDKVDEAEDVEVEDNENIDVDIEKDIKVDDEEKEVDIDVKASMPGESEDVEEVQALLMKAQQAASDLGDEKLMDQIGNTITYFTRSQVARVDEMDDLDVNLNTTEMEAEMGLEETKDNMDEEVKGDIKEEVKENLNESIFPMWNKIK
jgi:hypothetical protein